MIRPVLALARRHGVGLGMSGLMLAMSCPAIGQTLGQGRDTATPMWRVLGALVLCFALAFLGAWVIKARFQGKILVPGLFRLPARVRPERRLLLHETLRLTPQNSLSIVSCDGRELLIATSGNDVKLLETLPDLGGTAAEAPSSTV